MTGNQITLLINSLRGGGAEGVCVNVANGLVKEGWNVNLIVLHINDSVYQNRLSDKVNFTMLNVSHTRYSTYVLAKYLLKFKPKKLLVFNYELTVVVIMLKNLLRLDVKIITRNINTLSHKRKQESGIWRRYFVKPIIENFYCKADHIINQCEAMREDLLDFYPHIREKTSVIYNPINANIEEHAETLESTITKHDYLLCVGRLEKQKAFHLAIEAFAKVSIKFPELRLKIVGKGSLEKKLIQCSKDFGVYNKVDFEGFHNDIIPYYKYARATLLTSLYEGFPNILLESIALGTPVVAFDCQSGPSEIIVDNINGHLVPEGDINQMAVKIKSILLSPPDQYKIKKTATKFKHSEIITRYKEVIDGV